MAEEEEGEAAGVVRRSVRRKSCGKGEGDRGRAGRVKEKLVKFHLTLDFFVFSTHKKINTGYRTKIDHQYPDLSWEHCKRTKLVRQ